MHSAGISRRNVNLNPQFPVLIGDIGGTNARFGIVEAPGLPMTRFDPVRIADFASIEDALRRLVKSMPRQPKSMTLAIATPLVGDRMRLTNGDWVIDPASLIAQFGLDGVVLMNDFAAQALAALALDPGHVTAAGGAPVLARAPKVVIGPGTGLGIAFLVNVAERWAIIPGEGGHVDLGPRSQREMTIWPHLEKSAGRMSAENALSGRGLENLFRAICKADGLPPRPANASEISQHAVDGSNAQAAEAVELFLRLLARVAGDMALLTLARGGVYIGGGIGARFTRQIATPSFRSEFEDKSPHEAILKTIPLFVLTHPTGALDGLNAFVQHPDDFSLEMATRRFPARTA
jgi:glucokinase